MGTSDEEIKIHCLKDMLEQILIGEPTTTSSEFKWTNAGIKLLLQIRLGMEDEFNNPICKKGMLWESVARQINELLGYDITSDVCDSKYRNLLGTYRVNKRKERKFGKEAINWEFFEQIDQILEQKAAGSPPRNTLGSTLNGSSISFEIINNSDEESEPHVDSTTVIKREQKETVKKVKEISLERYLYLKLKEDKKKELVKLVREEERWNEKKELKLKEIDAINNLADAIRGNYRKN